MDFAARDQDGLSAAHRRALEASLERALAESTEPEVRFHIRQALQLLFD